MDPVLKSLVLASRDRVDLLALHGNEKAQQRHWQ